jgi:hypothetical protein
MPALLPAAPAPVAVEALPAEEAPQANEALPASEPVAAGLTLAQVGIATPPQAVLPAERDPLELAAAAAVDQPVATDAPFIDIAAIEQLAQDINAVRQEKLDYINRWNSITADCEAKRDRLFGGVSKPCRQVRMALARGEAFEFGFECANLMQRYDVLLNAHHAAATQSATRPDIDVALGESGRNLATFCGRDTYQQSYPAFAELFAQAESLEYYDPRTAGRRGKDLPNSTPLAYPTAGGFFWEPGQQVFGPYEPMTVVPPTTYDSQSTPVFTTP